MTTRIGYFFSTVGRKQVMAFAGLGLCVFVLSHVLGNLLMFVSPDAYNLYGHQLTSNPFIYVIEMGLLAIFGAHIVQALVLTLKNKVAKGGGYARAGTGDKKTSFTTKTMWWQGMVVLVFVVLHLITFKFGTVYMVTIDGEEVRDLFRLVVEVFQSPAYVIWYIFSVVLLGFHLAHGFQSSLQTLGLHHPKMTCRIKLASKLYGLFVAIGFAAQPVFMYFFYKG